MPYLSKYGVARKIRIPMVKRGVVDHAVSADWTPAAGDVKISKDGGATANVTNLPTAIAMGNSAIWEFSLTATEMQAAQVNVTIADTATKAVEDSAFDIETYGNASGQHAVDLADSVRAGLTALPNAAAEAAGGLYTRGTGAGQINQPANGMVDANVVRNAGTAITAASGIQEVKVASLAADSITASAIATDALGALELAAGAASEIATAVRTELTTELGRIDVATSTRLASASYTAPDNATITSIYGKVDTEIATLQASVDDLPTNAELATALGTADDAVLAQVALVKAKTDLIPAAPAAVGDVPTANANADALLDRAAGVETGLTVREAFRLFGAVLLGKLSGAGTATEVFRDVGDTKDRVTATVDASGNRTAITRDAT